MNNANLTTYLKDHLAGSVAAIELIEHLIQRIENTIDASEIMALKSEVESDQKVIKQLLERYAVEENGIKKAGAWIAEKMLMMKIKSGDGDLGLLEALEILVLGIEGKIRLWRSLELLDTSLDLPNLIQAATVQIKVVEALRLQAAQRAFYSACTRSSL